MRSALAVVVFSVLIAACRSPIAPPPPPPLPPPPPPPVNAPPSAAILSSLPLRVEAGEMLEIAADVQDAETPIDQLTYAWTAGSFGGTFDPVSGNPRRVKWQAPRAILPGAFAFELSVTERYQESGVLKMHQVFTASSMLHYNDSSAEVMRIAMRFITELFPTYAVTPAEAVQDFSDSCPGKQKELADVEGNRDNFRILSVTYSNVTVTVNSARTLANVTGICVFRDIPKRGPTAGLYGTGRGQMRPHRNLRTVELVPL